MVVLSGLLAASCFTRVQCLAGPADLDPTFTSPQAIGTIRVNAILVQPDDEILIGGSFENINNVSRSRIARLHSDGTLDERFVGNASDEVHALALQPDGRIVVAGNFQQFNGALRKRIVRVLNNGEIDESFREEAAFEGAGDVTALRLQPDGKIIVGGDFTLANGEPRGGLVRLNPDGTLDPAFQRKETIQWVVNAIALQSDAGFLALAIIRCRSKRTV